MNLSDALIVIDLQNGAVKEPNTFNFDDIVSHVNQRIDAYKDHPIIFIQHEDEFMPQNSHLWQIISDLKQPEHARYISKKHKSAFFETDLHNLLQSLGVKSIEVCGAETPFCVDTTIRTGHLLGYRINMFHNSVTTHGNDYMSDEQVNEYYEMLWGDGFVTFIDD